MDLIVFKVGTNRYALDIENVQRIVQAKELTTMPNAHPFIDGMMNCENSIIKVLSFRKLIGLPTYDKELYAFFTRLKTDYQNFMDALKDSIENGSPFKKSLISHQSELGLWLNNFNSYDADLSKILKSLIKNYKHLYSAVAEVLQLCQNNKDKACELLKTDLTDAFNCMISDINILIDSLDIVANSLQKMIIHQKETARFAIKVDSIEDIVCVEEKEIMSADEEDAEGLQLYGILEIDGNLVNIIKNIKIPGKGDTHGN